MSMLNSIGFYAFVFMSIVFFSIARFNIIQRQRIIIFRRVRAGVCYWRGRVFGVGEQGSAGVDTENGSGADCGAVGQTAAGRGLAVGLPGNAERSGALRGAGVAAGEGNKKVFHYQPLYRGSALAQRRGRVCQLIVDAKNLSQSILFMSR